jgi:hypothetical protein
MAVLVVVTALQVVLVVLATNQLVVVVPLELVL